MALLTNDKLILTKEEAEQLRISNGISTHIIVGVGNGQLVLTPVPDMLTFTTFSKVNAGPKTLDFVEDDLPILFPTSPDRADTPTDKAIPVNLQETGEIHLAMPGLLRQISMQAERHYCLNRNFTSHILVLGHLGLASLGYAIFDACEPPRRETPTTTKRPLDTPVKRGRGRPRKVVADTPAEPEAPTQPVKRGRGRPRKVVVPEVQTGLTNEDMDELMQPTAKKKKMMN